VQTSPLTEWDTACHYPPPPHPASPHSRGGGSKRLALQTTPQEAYRRSSPAATPHPSPTSLPPPHLAGVDGGSARLNGAQLLQHSASPAQPPIRTWPLLGQHC
jgi:hypothetical protein